LVFQVADAGRWAVEVTELHQYFDAGGSERPRVSAVKPVIDICRRIQERVADIKNHHYVITAEGPIDRMDRATVVDEAEAYIRSGETAERRLDDAGAVRIWVLQSLVQVDLTVGLPPDALIPGSDAPVSDL
jgi:hypothetical protein